MLRGSCAAIVAVAALLASPAAQANVDAALACWKRVARSKPAVIQRAFKLSAKQRARVQAAHDAYERRAIAHRAAVARHRLDLRILLREPLPKRAETMALLAKLSRVRQRAEQDAFKTYATIASLLDAKQRRELVRWCNDDARASARASGDRAPSGWVIPPDPALASKSVLRRRGKVSTVAFSTMPWSRVHVDGRLLGHTPLIARLAPGRHLVMLTNPSQSLVKRVVLNVKSGEVRTLHLRLADK
ncbi:MAG: hypothetical protein KC503_27110 [Myxococcales bacterium]|nr:hypothetical protein [Myxococcales bacterium]